MKKLAGFAKIQSSLQKNTDWKKHTKKIKYYEY